MPLVLSVILWASFAAAVAGIVHLWRSRLAAGRREDLAALAARRGWSLTETGERLGRAGTLRITPRGGPPWAALRRPESGRAAAATTDYESDAPRWADGTVVAVMAAWPEEPPDGGGGDRQATLRRLLGDELARLAEGLSPASGPEGLTVLADANPVPRVDLGDLGRALAGWRPVVAGERGLPVVVLSPDGLRLRLRHAIVRADQMERFIDLAHEVGRLIRP